MAEHIYGVQMLAIAMYSEYNYDIDIKKVITMLALHELEEIAIGDLTMFQISKEDKKVKGHEAIKEILKNLISKNQIENLIFEFDERKTPEALFAYYCDKLECDIQAKLYDLQGCVDLNHQEGNNALNDPKVQEFMKTGKSWSEMWMLFSQQNYNYDDNFLEVSNYALNNNIEKDS